MKCILVLLPLALAACGGGMTAADAPRAQCEEQAKNDPAVRALDEAAFNGTYMMQYNAQRDQQEAIRQATLRCLRLRGLAPAGGVEPVQRGNGLF
jgi:hypothetical protein